MAATGNGTHHRPSGEASCCKSGRGPRRPRGDASTRAPRVFPSLPCPRLRALPPGRLPLLRAFPFQPRALLALFALFFLTTLLAPTAATAAPGPSPGGATQAAALAAHLRTDPVYLTDQLPRAVPRSTAPDFARLAERSGVPTYVMVLPGDGTLTAQEGLLGAVHDRLGRDGLYVLVDETSVAAARAFGVRAPAEDARTVQQFELPFDAGPLLSFERFVDVVALGGPAAAKRAEAAREEYGGHGPYGEGYKEPEPLYISATDRDNQNFLTGIALAGLPLLVLMLSPYARRWWRRRPAAAAPRTPRPPRAAEAAGEDARGRRSPRVLHWGDVVAAAAVAAAVALTATLLFDQTTSSAGPPPTTADMTARVDRVAAGLRTGTLYSDVESPRVLDAGEIDRLRSRVAEFKTAPVHIALVPQLTDDESAGRPDAFADALHAELGEPGVYVVADPSSGDIDVVTHHVRIDADLVAFDLPDTIRFADADDGSDDHRLGPRLNELLTFLEKAPRTDSPETSSYRDPTPPDPVEERALPPLFDGDFWPGLAIGASGALLAFGLAAGVLGVLRRAVPALRPPSGTVPVARTGGRPPTGGLTFEASPRPSLTDLRRAAQDELRLLGAEFDPEATLRPAVRSRVWDCLDAATLLADRVAVGPDGRVDDGVPPADLAAVVVLARMGRAALADGDTGKPPCALNPLHGPATGWRDAQYTPADSRRRTIPVCAACRTFVTQDPGLAHTRRLTLPGRAGGRGADRVPYEDAPGPMSATRKGLPQLIRQVREYAGVQ